MERRSGVVLLYFLSFLKQIFLVFVAFSHLLLFNFMFKILQSERHQPRKEHKAPILNMQCHVHPQEIRKFCQQLSNTEKVISFTNLLSPLFGLQQLKILCDEYHPWFLAQHIRYVDISHLLQEDWTGNKKVTRKL